MQRKWRKRWMCLPTLLGFILGKIRANQTRKVGQRFGITSTPDLSERLNVSFGSQGLAHF